MVLPSMSRIVIAPMFDIEGIVRMFDIEGIAPMFDSEGYCKGSASAIYYEEGSGMFRNIWNGYRGLKGISYQGIFGNL